jgi:beta-phosphoglucomutase-like phosphatase (HAD superfamily)
VVFHLEWILLDLRQFRDLVVNNVEFQLSSGADAATKQRRNPTLFPASHYQWDTEFAEQHACMAEAVSAMVGDQPRRSTENVEKWWRLEHRLLFPREPPLFQPAVALLHHLLRKRVPVAIVSEWSSDDVCRVLQMLNVEPTALACLVSAVDDFVQPEQSVPMAVVAPTYDLCRRLYSKVIQRLALTDARSCLVFQAFTEGLQATSDLGMWPVALPDQHILNNPLRYDAKCKCVFQFEPSPHRLWRTLLNHYAHFRRVAVLPWVDSTKRASAAAASVSAAL